jgi:methanogenic corrinoid protein MtbC1
MGRTEDAVLLAGRPLGAERHVCAFFHTLEEEYRALMPFVLEGFARGEKAIHFVDPMRREHHLVRLHDAGIDVDAARRRGQLEVLDWNDTYLRGGGFDQRATLGLMADLLRRTRTEGWPRARMIGYGVWDQPPPIAPGPLVEYESRVNDLLPGYDDPVVCAYDLTGYPGGTMMDVLRAHPAANLDGALFRNPCHLPAARLLPRLHGRPIALQRERFLTALIAGARAAALDIVLDEALAQDIPVPRIYLDLIQATLHEIGRLWQEKRISETQEHLATEVARIALAHLRGFLPSRPCNGQRVVVACVEGEQHDLGARMVADFFEMAGFDVTFLGANVPTDGLVRLVHERPPRLLALSASTSASLGPLRRTIAAVRRVAGKQVALAAGGRALLQRPGLARRLRVDLHARQAADAAVAIRRLLGA